MGLLSLFPARSTSTHSNINKNIVMLVHTLTYWLEFTHPYALYCSEQSMLNKQQIITADKYLLSVGKHHLKIADAFHSRLLTKQE